MAAVKQNGEALRYASAELKGDREVVMAAVKQDWRALEYASEELKGDREVMMAADKQRDRESATKTNNQTIQANNHDNNDATTPSTHGGARSGESRAAVNSACGTGVCDKITRSCLSISVT